MRTGIYEAWGLPGGELIEEPITATEMKPIGAFVIIASASRKFRIHHLDNWGDNTYPWRLLENHPVGTDGAHDNYEEIDTFRSFKEARTEARRLARGQ